MSQQGQKDKSAKVVLYTTVYCGYCFRAVDFLKKKGVKFTQIDVTLDLERRKWLISATGRRTLPQCFINDRSVGGYTELLNLERRGELDALLSEAPSSPRDNGTPAI